MPFSKILLNSFLFYFALLVSKDVLAQSYQSDESCKQKVSQIEEKISEAQICSLSEDCKSVWLGCPFGCGTPININKVDEIEKSVEIYSNSECRKCKYDCSSDRREIICSNGRCTWEKTLPANDSKK